MVRTVTGDIPPEKLGKTLCHEHFIVNLDRVRKDGVSKIETVEDVLPEIRKAMAQGIQSAVEVTTVDMGRDVRKLHQLSLDSGLNIIASTGFYLSEYHPDFLKNMSIDEAADLYCRELLEGIDGTDIKAGMIGEIASNKKGFCGQEEKILRAAARASRRTGAPIYTHTNQPNGLRTVEILLEEGVNPDKVIIGHQDLINDRDYLLSIVEKGFNVGFDTCGKTAYQPDETRAANISFLIEQGYGDQIVLSNDISRKTYFTSQGGPGYTAVMGSVIPKLKDLNISQDAIDRLLIHTPARILDNRWEE